MSELRSENGRSWDSLAAGVVDDRGDTNNDEDGHACVHMCIELYTYLELYITTMCVSATNGFIYIYIYS